MVSDGLCTPACQRPATAATSPFTEEPTALESDRREVAVNPDLRAPWRCSGPKALNCPTIVSGESSRGPQGCSLHGFCWGDAQKERALPRVRSFRVGVAFLSLSHHHSGCVCLGFISQFSRSVLSDSLRPHELQLRFMGVAKSYTRLSN